MDQRHIAFAVTFILAAATGLLAHEPHGRRDSDRIRYLQDPADAPDPFSPSVGEVNRLTNKLAVRAVSGLRAKDKKPSKHENLHFYVKVTWIIAGGKTVTGEVELVPPLTYIKLPAHRPGRDRNCDDDDDGRDGNKLFVVVPDIVLSWDGRNTTGSLVDPATYAHEAFTEYRREREVRRGIREKEIDETEDKAGTVTVQGGQHLSLTVAGPADGKITNLQEFEPAISRGRVRPTVLNSQEPHRVSLLRR